MRIKEFFIHYLDFIPWIALFFFHHLPWITQPPVEVSHNWRQTDVTMIARNYFEGESSLFYPKVDVCGEKSGITGAEF